MFTSNPPTTKRRTPHGSFSRSSQIPLPSTSNSLVPPPTRLESNSPEPESNQVGTSSSKNNYNNNHDPLSIPSGSEGNRRGSIQEVNSARQEGNTSSFSYAAANTQTNLSNKNGNNNNNYSRIPSRPNAYPNGTSVNIATAFTQALENNGKRVGSGKEREKDNVEEEDEESGSGKETQSIGRGVAGDGVSKKRKKRTSTLPTAKNGAGESESEDELQEGSSRSTAKRSKKEPSVEVEIIRESPRRSSNRKKSADATYQPSPPASPTSANLNNLAVDDGSSSEEDRSKRRTSRGKRRSSAGPSGNSSQAILIGRRDSEVWMGKKRKARKGGRGTSGSGSGSQRDSVSVSVERQDEEEGGGMGGFNYQPDQDYQEELPSTTATYFLRPKSPSPSASPEPDTLSARLNRFDSQYEQSNDQEEDEEVDPTFAAFDQSLNNTFDESGIRGSSYDYSEEERIVAAIEAEKVREREGSVASSSSVSTSGLRNRRNRIPSPPILNSIEEEESVEEEVVSKRSVGTRMGETVRPLVEVGINSWKKVNDPNLDWWKVFKALGFTTAILSLLIIRFSSINPSNLNPFASSKSTTHSYMAPTLPPESFDILVQRLSLLERSLGDLSAVNDYERIKSDNDRTKLEVMSSQLDNFHSVIENNRDLTSQATNRLEIEVADGSKEFAKSLQQVNSDLSSLVSRVESLARDRTIDESSIETLRSGVEGVGKDVASLTAKVDQISKNVEAGVESERITKIALKAIESYLPSRLAVRMDSKGKLEIDPSFWKSLKEAFFEKKGIESLVNSRVALEMSKVPSASSGAGVPSTGLKPPTWEDFLSSNEDSLRAWIHSDITSRLGTDAIVSKKTFMNTLQREIKNLKLDFETKSNENIEKIGQELLTKVAKQEQMKKDQIPPSTRPSSSSNSPSPQFVIKSTDGENISDLVESLVDTALLKYSKDVLARPDYALGTSGARVVPSLTSNTFEARPVGLTPRFLGWITRTGVTLGRPPITALHPYNSPGYCWPFAGSQGQLGILLSRVVIPEDITLEHVSKDVAIEGDVGSAPKDFEVWGVIEGNEDIEKLRDFRLEQLKEKRRKASQGEEEEEEVASSLPLSPSHLLLAIGSYDITSPSPIQTFPVTSTARELGIPVGLVIVKILSNHGESQYTCLYRVRVSGTSLAEVSRSREEA